MAECGFEPVSIERLGAGSKEREAGSEERRAKSKERSGAATRGNCQHAFVAAPCSSLFALRTFPSSICIDHADNNAKGYLRHLRSFFRDVKPCLLATVSCWQRVSWHSRRRLCARLKKSNMRRETEVTYRVTRQIVQHPVVETRMETRQQTVYVDQYKSQTQAVQRTYQTPVTEYYWEAYWANRWNPFEPPYIAYRYVPRVRWELHTETVQMPVSCHQVVPQTQTVQVPVTTQHFVDEEITSRMPVNGRPGDPFANGTTSVARVPESLVPPPPTIR